MKKKIAIFGSGWSEEYLKLVLTGIQKKAAECHADLYTFINYSSGPESEKDNLGEKSIFTLPDLTTFDGIILLTNTMNLPAERRYFAEEILRHHIPAVSLEYKLEGIPCLYTDTYSAVHHLAMHLIQEHQAQHIVYVSGPQDNLENQLRQKAVNDALATIGKTLSSDDIIPGEWSYYAASRHTEKWLHTHSLPDAFMCANDEMALAVCSVLDSAGIRIPADVIVTGCDCIHISQHLYPMLTTVAREWDKLGYDGLDCVLRQINGEIVSENTEYSSVPIFGESCGCKVTDERIQKRRRSIINNCKVQKENAIFEWHLRNVDDMLACLTNIHDLKNHLGWNFSYDHSFEGENVLICLNATFLENRIQKSYSPKMETYLHLEHGHTLPDCTFPRSALLPSLDIPAQETNSFLFLPLHTGEDLLGYVVFINRLDILYTQSLYTWTKHLSQDLERVRQNIRMEELNKKLTEVSMTDALTGLKNRTGYDALAVPALQKYQQEGKSGCMIFADINRMKQINDKYGHLQGDYAICTVAEAIRRTFPSDWLAVRFGGDEFILVGECSTAEKAEELKQQLSANLEAVKQERRLCFPLTASFGAVIMNPEENYTLEEYLRKADEAMYVMKQIAHAKE